MRARLAGIYIVFFPARFRPRDSLTEEQKVTKPRPSMSSVPAIVPAILNVGTLTTLVVKPYLGKVKWLPIGCLILVLRCIPKQTRNKYPRVLLE